MAVLASIATGNLTAAATWGLVDATSYLNAETSSEILTTAGSGTRSSAFTPGAIVVSHIGVKLSGRTGTTGTISVRLVQATVEVAGTLVTINVADLPVATTGDINGGWQMFKLSAPVTLAAATAYNVEAFTSSASQVSLFRDVTVDNIARILVTTTTQAPVAGDDMIIAGEKTGAGTSNAFTVTMNQTAATDYGAASTSLVLPSLAINQGGTLSYGIAAATNYQLRQSGNVIVYSGGTFNMGTVAVPIPRDSTALLNFDSGANVDFGLTVRNLGTFVAQGQSRTIANLSYFAKLNTNEAVAQTVLGVDTATGWLAGDEIGIVSTSRTGSETELRTLSVNASATELTVTAGLTNAHSGTSPTQAEIINLTRNVRIQGASATLQTYIDIKATAQVNIDWTSFRWLGSATALKRGIDITTTTGSSTFHYCSFHDWTVASSIINIAGSTNDNFTFQHCVSYNMVTTLTSLGTSGTAWVVDNWVDMGGSTGSGVGFAFGDVGGTITNITSAGRTSTGVAINISEAGGNIGTIGTLTAHSNAGVNMSLSGFYNGTITGTLNNWRGNSVGMQINVIGDVIINALNMFGNTTSNIQVLSGIENVYINNAVLSGDTSFSTLNGITLINGTGGTINFNDSTFGVVSGIKTNHTRDIFAVLNEFLNLKFNNCLLASTTEVGSQTVMPPGQTISSSRHDQTAGNHRTFKREGTITVDTTAGFFDVSPSIRIAPTLAAEKCEGASFRSAVTNGLTLTVTVRVRESVAGDGTDYNGNFIRLLVKQNVAAGITADTVLATADASSAGAFQTLSGTTIAVTDDAVLEFVVDCDGTTGWVNYDTWTVTTQASTLGLQYWKDGQPVAYGDNSAGGSSGGSFTFG